MGGTKGEVRRRNRRRGEFLGPQEAASCLDARDSTPHFQYWSTTDGEEWYG